MHEPAFQRVVVASTNPFKVDAVRLGYERVFKTPPRRLDSVEVPSGVASQPIGDEETYRGALQRAQRARELVPDADLWFGIEGGVIDYGVRMHVCSWVVVFDDANRFGECRDATFAIPGEIADLVRSGYGLATACNHFFERTETRPREGPVGLLTHYALRRVDPVVHAVVLALVPLINPELQFVPDALYAAATSAALNDAASL